MSKKPDTASAFASILNARRKPEETPPPAVVASPPPTVETVPTPSPAPPVAAPVKKVGRPAGKRSDTATIKQFSVYLRKDTRKQVGRMLEDGDSGQDFSDLVQSLLEQWLKSNA